MTETHCDTSCCLLVKVGDGYAKIMDEKMRELCFRHAQVDELRSGLKAKPPAPAS